MKAVAADRFSPPEEANAADPIEVAAMKPPSLAVTSFNKG